MKWRIYYDSGTFDSSMGMPHEAPVEGFQCAVGYDFMGTRYIQSGYNFYFYHTKEERWWGVDLAGLFDCLRRQIIYAYKEGRSIPRRDFESLMQMAHEDKDFPQKP
jgi:hypothetical protein